MRGAWMEGVRSVEGHANFRVEVRLCEVAHHGRRLVELTLDEGDV